MAEFSSVAATKRLVERVEPDLIHSMTIKPNLYAGLATRLGPKIPLLMSITGLGYVFLNTSVPTRLMRGMVLLLYRWVSSTERVRLLFQNADDRALFLKSGIGDQGRCIQTGGAGVDVGRFSPKPEPNGPPTVVLPSRLLWDKGIGEYAQAAEMLRTAGVSARFALVGDTDPGNPAAVPKGQIIDWHNAGVVEWWGYQKDMAHVFAQANIVCLPSYREGMPKALIEAASCGRAIVTTDVPGCREVVRHGDNGLLVPARNARALADALSTLISNPKKRSQMGMRGRELAVSELSQERSASDMLRIYQTVLS